MIKTVGLHIPHKGILEILLNYSGVRVDGEVVFFSEHLVEYALEKSNYKLPDMLLDRYFISSGAHQDTINDLNSGELKPSILSDLKVMTKLCDSVGITGSAPVRSMDVLTHMQEILMYKVLWEVIRGKRSLFIVT